MATIFAYPNSTGSGNCVILAPQENYYAPFLSNIGNWNQIRVSAYLSYCGSGGFQFPFVQETINVTSANLGFYWGVGNFSTSLGSLLTPLSVGCNFVGSSTYGQPQSIIEPSVSQGNTSWITTVDGQNKMGTLFANGGNFISNTSTAGDYFFLPPAANTGAFNYCVPLTMVFTIFNKGLTGQQISFLLNYDATGGLNPNFYSFTDIQTLRIASMNLLGSGIKSQTSFTTFYTTGLVATGGPLQIPDTVFLRSPFNNNFLRIHNLLVEKFS